MNDLAQQITIAAIVVVALGYLLTRNRKKSCGTEGGCGCTPKKRPAE